MSHTFNKDHFNSGEGMLTSIWGPGLWHFLHTMSFNYPVKPTKEQKDHYHNFVMSLQNILPCKYCRINLPNNLKKAGYNKHVLRNRTSFSKFIYNLHQEVNCMLGKKVTLTYCDVRDRYEHFRSRCLNKKPKKKSKYEDGCVDPLYGKKSKCVLQIVPKTSRIRSFRMSPKCKIKSFKEKYNFKTEY